MTPASSFEERQLLLIVEAAQRVGLEFVVIGNASAAMQGAPIMTQDIDLFVRDSKRNREKIRALATALGASCNQPFLPGSEMFRLETNELVVDCLFRLSSNQRFESVRSRAIALPIGALVATLEDVILQKRAAGRAKDKATLPILEQTLKVRELLEKAPKRK